MLKGASDIQWMAVGPRSLSRQNTNSSTGGWVDELDFSSGMDSLAWKIGRTESMGPDKYMLQVVWGYGGELFLVFLKE